MSHPDRLRYLKYAVPVVIVLVLGLFFLFRLTLEKKTEGERLEKEAVERVEALREESEEPVDLERADRFVGAQTPLSKKERQIITTTPKALQEDQSFQAESPIRVLVEEEKTTITTLRELLKNKTIGQDTPLRIVRQDGSVETITVKELLADQSITEDTPIKIVQKEEEVIATTLAELEKTVPSPDAPVKIVVEKPGATVTLRQILPEDQSLGKKTFYIHSVTKDDVQGIWGIIQHGLMDQFLRGVPVVVGEAAQEKKFLTLEIPEAADEPRADGYSSYLGRILARKTRESYVYNYAEGRMGKNPDYISPGQELVVSRFSEEELVGIYKHFHQNP